MIYILYAGAVILICGLQMITDLIKHPFSWIRCAVSVIITALLVSIGGFFLSDDER